MNEIAESNDSFEMLFQNNEIVEEINTLELQEYGNFDLGPRIFRSVNVEEFLLVNENKGTKKKTDSDIKLIKTFFFSKNEIRDPELIPPQELNSLMCDFLLAVTKKDGGEYEPTTLRGFVSSLERYLKHNQSRMDIIKDIDFARMREVLKMKMKQLKSLGMGNKPKTATTLTDHHIDLMYECDTLGDKTPRSLLHSMWLVCTTMFGLRTGKEIHSLRWGDIIVQIDAESGEEYLVLNTERQTKTRTGVNPKDTRLVKPRAYAMPGQPQKDPVHLYKTYRDKRPKEMMETESPFFLSANDNGLQWFKKTPMGINKIYNIMNEMKTDAGIDDSRITPYSARKRLVQKLTDEDIPANQIIQISGHRNVNSINNYSAINNNQSRQISRILSGASNSVPVSSESSMHVSSTQNLQTRPTVTPSIPSGFFANTHFNGNVTFNFNCETQNLSQIAQNMGSPDSPVVARKYKRIRLLADSDSD